jgi:glucose uptake protein GlcU
MLTKSLKGIMWGLANICYFNANNVLAQAVIFPISNSGPPIVANLWAVLFYKEITGKRNLLFLMLGFAVALTGATLCGLSI